MATTFNLEAKTVIASATLDLSAVQLEQLAAAQPHLQEVCEVYVVSQTGVVTGDATERLEPIVALDPVMALLNSIASLVDQTGTIKPKRKPPVRRKPKKVPA